MFQAIFESLGLWFTFGSIGSIIILTIASLFIFGCVETNSTSWSIVWGILLFAILGPLVSHIHPWYYAVGSIIGYFIIGGVWSVWRYRCFVREQFQAFKLNWKEHQITHPEEYKRELYGVKRLAHPGQQKSRLYLWITFWPYSFVWSFIGDIVKSISEYLSDVYIRIMDKEIKNASI